MNSFYPSAAERVDMERHNAVRQAMRFITADYQQFTRDQIRAHVVRLMLDSVTKQARWSAGLETVA